jgi:hypothetical protein
MSPPSDDPRPRHLSSFHLEALRLGVASDEERAWAEAHRIGCERCAALARELDGFRQDFATQTLPRTRAAVSQAVQRRPPRRWWSLAALLVPVAAAAVFLLVPRAPLAIHEEDPAVLAKGGTALGIVVRREGQIFAAPSGTQVRPGDQIRFVLRSVTQRYALIASVDGAGRANIYVPYDGKESVAVSPGQRVELDGSIELDGTLGPERIFALLSRTPLTAEAVRKSLAAIGAGGAESIRNTAALAVPAEAQASVLLEKVAQ